VSAAVTISELTPLRFLERSAEVHPRKVAIVHDDRRISKIARYKAPASVDFVDQLPKTSTGKIQKNVLRERARASAGA
jgi:acyl-CoA synthetase (AMP-forming)/AMP-acid ligase II